MKTVKLKIPAHLSNLVIHINDGIQNLNNQAAMVQMEQVTDLTAYQYGFF
jgi:hypothetical protein